MNGDPVLRFVLSAIGFAGPSAGPPHISSASRLKRKVEYVKIERKRKRKRNKINTFGYNLPLGSERRAFLVLDYTLIGADDSFNMVLQIGQNLRRLPQPNQFFSQVFLRQSFVVRRLS